MLRFTKLSMVFMLGGLILGGCTAAKLEARMEANPQCKEVINPKTGALMPCPGTDKSFYRSVGLEPVKSSSQSQTVIADRSTTSSTPNAVLSDAGAKANAIPSAKTSSSSTNIAPQSDCKPQLHKKTGSMLPCPSPD